MKSFSAMKMNIFSANVFHSSSSSISVGFRLLIVIIITLVVQIKGDPDEEDLSFINPDDREVHEEVNVALEAVRIKNYTFNKTESMWKCRQVC
jgi:hypothetical protein